MKITKITKISYANFKNFEFKEKVKDFENVNIIFGWNGSGKTTLSKIFRFLENRECDEECDFVFTINNQLCTKLGLLYNDSFKNSVRVFNKDYIESILKSNQDIPHIFYIGKESINYLNKEEELEKEKKKKKEKNEECVNNKNQCDNIAKIQAKRIKEVSGINNVIRPYFKRAKYSFYNRTHLEKCITILHCESIANNNADRINYIKNRYLKNDDEINQMKSQLNSYELQEDINQAIQEVNSWIKYNQNNILHIMQETPQQMLSQRIVKMTSKEAEWLKEGTRIHFHEKEEQKEQICLFCNSIIQNKEELILHFTDAVLDLSNKIEDFISITKNQQNKLKSINKKLIYEDKKEIINSLYKYLDTLFEQLNKKKESISTKIPPFTLFDTQKYECFQDMQDKKQQLAHDIENHYAAEIYEEYMAKKQKYQKSEEELREIKETIAILKKEVNELKFDAKDKHLPAKILNQKFKNAFSYRNIKITDNDDETGYELKRDGKKCKLDSLSEGERNFIALTYFVTSLKDDTLNKEAIIIIDDPVSSVDTSLIFKIYSSIVNEIESEQNRQYFIMTHNMDFLAHLLRKYGKIISNKNNKRKINAYNIFLTKNGSDIENINPILLKNKTEYHYIFSELYKRQEPTKELTDSYLIVNLLRRWLEIFLSFKFSDDNLGKMLKKAYEDTGFIKNNAYNYTEMYQFLNHGSHGFAYSKSIDESILNNASHKIQEAFALIKEIDLNHWKSLKESLKDTNK